jgi:hypothetical protein
LYLPGSKASTEVFEIVIEEDDSFVVGQVIQHPVEFRSETADIVGVCRHVATSRALVIGGLAFRDADECVRRELVRRDRRRALVGWNADFHEGIG